MNPLQRAANQWRDRRATGSWQKAQLRAVRKDAYSHALDNLTHLGVGENRGFNGMLNDQSQQNSGKPYSQVGFERGQRKFSRSNANESIAAARGAGVSEKKITKAKMGAFKQASKDVKKAAPKPKLSVRNAFK